MNEGPHPHAGTSAHTLTGEAASRVLNREQAPSGAKPSWAPAKKVGGGVAIGAPLAVVLRWAAAEAGLEVPEDVVIAITGLLIGFFAWLIPERP